MTGYLIHLLDAVWEHDLPLGPEGDLDYRERSEREWQESLTVNDCLALLAWVESPVFPPTWEAVRQRWLPSLIDSAARHAGRAGRRLSDVRIGDRLIALLKAPHCRHMALEGLIEFGTPMAFEALLECLGDSRNRIEVCIAIAACASVEQVVRLRQMREDPELGSELRNEISEVIEEREAVDREAESRTSRRRCNDECQVPSNG